MSCLLLSYIKERIDYISIKPSIDMKGESPPILRHRVYTHAHWLASTRAHAINR